MWKAHLASLILTLAIVQCGHRAALSQSDNASHALTHDEDVDVPGIRICWQERGGLTHGVLNRHVDFTRATAADIEDLADRLNVGAATSSATIWMESLAPDVVPALAGVKSLEALTMIGSRFSPDTRGERSKCRSLKWLSLEGCQVNRAVCRRLSRIPGVETLHLAGSELTDEGLEHLCRLHTLTELDLRGTKVSDAGLANLCQCRLLRFLDIRGTAVTSAGANKLRARLPRIHIRHRRLRFQSLPLAARTAHSSRIR